jgi:outer membrane murein-binding lipoprotein Lpp
VLQLKQKDVQQLLSQVDELANENRSQAEVYQAMSDSLNEAWKDLNTQLEYRKMLLDQSIAFHQSAQQVR